MQGRGNPFAPPPSSVASTALPTATKHDEPVPGASKSEGAEDEAATDAPTRTGSDGTHADKAEPSDLAEADPKPKPSAFGTAATSTGFMWGACGTAASTLRAVRLC